MRIHGLPCESVTDATATPLPVNTASTSRWPFPTPVSATVCVVAPGLVALADWTSGAIYGLPVPRPTERELRTFWPVARAALN